MGATACTLLPDSFSNVITKESSPFHRPCRYHSNLSAPDNILDHLPTLALPCPGFVSLCEFSDVCMHTLDMKECLSRAGFLIHHLVVLSTNNLLAFKSGSETCIVRAFVSLPAVSPSQFVYYPRTVSCCH